ncbi:MAG: multicopper oxidase domain-containing protein [Leptolyngbyaceae cyanobacterium MO_188.B28]|nr:multicopper oxidase domain-containing protein [Leptolyngbyaceae cyanobacterium MO_188.B28]
MRVRFTDFPGKTVYHCHILDHEDLGMMGTLEIQG